MRTQIMLQRWNNDSLALSVSLLIFPFCLLFCVSFTAVTKKKHFMICLRCCSALTVSRTHMHVSVWCERAKMLFVPIVAIVLVRFSVCLRLSHQHKQRQQRANGTDGEREHCTANWTESKQVDEPQARPECAAKRFVILQFCSFPSIYGI